MVSFRPFTEINASVRKGRADNYRKGTRKLRARVQLQDTRQKDRSKKRIHSVNPFCFIVFRPQSLLDFLESRVMKRKSINHCEERSEMERWKILHSAKDLGVGIGIEVLKIKAR